MKYHFLFIITILWSCNSDKVRSEEIINEEASSQQYFKALMAVTENQVPENERQDSLSFLILPLQASCPSCRKKTLDSIIKHQHDLRSRHFIVINSTEGKQAIEGHFYSRKSKMPELKGRLFLDTVNFAGQLGLYNVKPTMFYAYQGKVYKRVNAVPQTVKTDLHEFFSGYRSNQ